MADKKFAALMLFQFRNVKKNKVNKKRVCEERIIIFEEDTADSAYRKALKRGKEEETEYEDSGVKILFEFVGIMEMVELGASFEDDEVWCRLIEKIEPMENKNKLIPKKTHLLAFKTGNVRKQGRLFVPSKSIRSTVNSSGG